MNSKILLKLLLGLSLVGFVDAAYLTISHFQNQVPPCTISGCETVLTSEYAVIAGVPLALIGTLFYVTVFFLVLLDRRSWLVILLSIGFMISMGLLALQIFVIHAICQYCLVSIITTTLLLVGSLVLLRRDHLEVIP